MHAAAVVALAVLVRTSAPALAAGRARPCCSVSRYLSVGSLVRARWAYVLDGRPELATAMSLESVLDELIFVIGPLIATMLATQTVPVLVLYVAVALVAGGSLWLSTLHASEPPVHDRPGRAARVGAARPRHAHADRAPRWRWARSSPAPRCRRWRSAASTGSAAPAASRWPPSPPAAPCPGCLRRARPPHRLARSASAGRRWSSPCCRSCCWRAVNVPLLVVAGIVLGLGIAPTLITAFGLVQQLVAPRRADRGPVVDQHRPERRLRRRAPRWSAASPTPTAPGPRSWSCSGRPCAAGALALVLVARVRGGARAAPEPVAVGAGWENR